MERFKVSYRVKASTLRQAQEVVDWVRFEQSVELPPDVLDDAIKETIVGQIEELAEEEAPFYKAVVSFPVDLMGDEITQLLNVLMGNVSLNAAVKVVGLEWEKIQDLFRGPRFGMDGLRALWGVSPQRPLSCTALKPVSSSAGKLGKMCYELALGGLDIIKDDHGIANQPWAVFEDRLRACTIAVKRAWEQSGHRAHYFPNITATYEETLFRYQRAAELGADGVLICPHLVGLDILKRLSAHPARLPIMAHPAFSGSLVQFDGGFSHAFLYGDLWRALGADFSIYPNVGGRFTFDGEVCEAINRSCRQAFLGFKKSFPTPGGGIEAKRIRDWINLYGSDTCFLVGGSLRRHPQGLQAAARAFQQALQGE